MTKTARARYALEFRKEAVRLVEGGQSIAHLGRGRADLVQLGQVPAPRQAHRG